MWDDGFISTGGVESRPGYRGFAPGELEAELDLDAPLAGLAAEVKSLLPKLAALGCVEFTAAEAGAGAVHAMDQPLEEYGRSWFSVVTETEMRGRVLRITEKSLKPLLNFHPFLVLGNPGSLALLRTYGFRSFPELFDESYDEETDPARRFEMVFRELTRLCSLDEAELDRAEAATEEAIIHNARRGLAELPRLFAAQLDDAFVQMILRAAALGWGKLPPFGPQQDSVAALVAGLSRAGSQPNTLLPP